jgi:hypothetical protein
MSLGHAVLVLVPVLTLASCASHAGETFERGWIGGRFADVSRGHEPEITARHHDDVVGMPASAPGDHAALVTAAYAGTPLARAGLVPGDLVLSLGGEPTDGALELRERIEQLPPGTTAEATYWRAGEVRSAPVVVGRETWESAGLIQIALGISGTLDLWPFDDGIDIFGLVRVRWDGRRHDLDDPVTAYRRQLDPQEEITGPPQEVFEVFVLPLGLSKGKRVLRQETLP